MPHDPVSDDTRPITRESVEEFIQEAWAIQGILYSPRFFTDSEVAIAEHALQKVWALEEALMDNRKGAAA